MRAERSSSKLWRGTIILTGLLALLGWAVQARVQAPAKAPGLKTFLVILEARATFLADATPAEQQMMGQHVAFLGELNKSGKMVFGGRRTNAPYAVLVLEAASQKDAERIVGEDPSVRAGVLQPQVHEFMLVFQRGKQPSM